MRIPRATLAAGAFFAVSCAWCRSPSQVMVFPPVTIVAGPTDLSWPKLNAAELFAKGKAPSPPASSARRDLLHSWAILSGAPRCMPRWC